MMECDELWLTCPNEMRFSDFQFLYNHAPIKAMQLCFLCGHYIHSGAKMKIFTFFYWGNSCKFSPTVSKWEGFLHL
jgi:hypothetical protein